MVERKYPIANNPRPVKKEIKYSKYPDSDQPSEDVQPVTYDNIDSSNNEVSETVAEKIVEKVKEEVTAFKEEAIRAVTMVEDIASKTFDGLSGNHAQQQRFGCVMQSKGHVSKYFRSGRK